MDVSQVCSRIAHCWSVIIQNLTQEEERHILAMMFSYPFLFSCCLFWMYKHFLCVCVWGGGMLKCWYPLPNLIYNRALHFLYVVSEMLFYLKTFSSSLENDDALCHWVLLIYLLLEAAPWGCIWTSWPFFSLLWHHQWGTNPLASLNLAPQLPSATAPR